MKSELSKIILCLYVLLTCGVVLAQQAPCILQADSVQFLCFDQFTPLDSTDDYFLVQFQVNGGAGNDTDSFTIYWQGLAAYGHYAYGSNIVLNFPADSSSFVIYMHDLHDVSCIDSILVPALLPCSVPCHFELDTKVEIHCNNATTVNTTADDYYSVSFEIPSSSTKNGYYVYLDGDSVGLFSYNRLNYFNHPADSLHHTIEFIDSRDSNCYFRTILGRFISCSYNCYIQQEYLSMACHNNDSPFDILDDVVEVTAVFNAFHPTDSFQLYINQSLWATAAFGDTLVFDLPFAGDSIYVTIRDLDKIECSKDFVWVVPGPCSIDCRQFSLPGIELDSLMALDCNHTCKTLQIAAVEGWNTTWIHTDSGVSYQQDSLFVCTPGQYTVTLTHMQTGCPGPADTLQVVVDTMVQKPIIESKRKNENLCDSAIYQLTAWVGNGQEFQWHGLDGIHTSAEIWVSGPAQLTLTTLNPRNGCSDSVSISLSGPLSAEKLYLVPYTDLNCTQRSTLLSVDTTKYHSHEIIQWKKPGNSSQWQTTNGIVATEGGWYEVRIGDASGTCFIDTTLEVLDLSEKIYPQLSHTALHFCDHDSSVLQLSVKNEKGQVLDPATYSVHLSNKDGQWYSIGHDSTQFIVAGTGKYVVNVIRHIDGCAGADSVVLEASKQTTVSWSGIQPACDGSPWGEIHLETERNAIDNWYINENLQVDDHTSKLEPGTYQVTAVDTHGCKHDTILFLHPVKKLMIHAPSLIELDYGTSTKVAAEINRTLDELEEYSWSPHDQISCSQCMETWVEGREDETLTFAARDTAGCIAEVDVEIRVKREVIITVPNIISDAQKENSRFTIYGNEHVNKVAEITIYDRWGNQVWHTDADCLNNPSAGWDGQINGMSAVNGVYTYTALVEIYNGEKRWVNGDITRFFR